jgi:hypothetical protein
MARCGAGECECECKNGCGCISSSDDPTDCVCRCFGGLTAPNFGVFANVTSVQLTFRHAPASQVATSLSRALGVEIAVPTKMLNKRITVSLKKTPVRKVIKHLGFVEVPKRNR